MNDTGTRQQYDAILLAGEGKHSYKVANRHKAFLRLNGRYVISHVLEALQKSRSVRDIYIVGPTEALRLHLKEDGLNLEVPKRIHILEQRRNLYENIWYTFLATLPKDVEEKQLESSPYRDRAVLIVPCDSPFITPQEIDYFVANADLRNYDHVLGLTPEERLEPFYPAEGKPGIKMAYLHMKEKRYRINNLHMVRPIRIKNRHYIQKMYHYRYQRDLKNVLLFGLELIGKDKKNRYRYYIGLIMGLFLNNLNLPGLVNYFRSWVPKKGLEECISSILDTRFMALEVPYAGAALDIDNNKDFQTIQIRFHEWKNYLDNLVYPTGLSASSLPESFDVSRKVAFSRLNAGTMR